MFYLLDITGDHTRCEISQVGKMLGDVGELLLFGQNAVFGNEFHEGNEDFIHPNLLGQLG
jgi:hypothetical protein